MNNTYCFQNIASYLDLIKSTTPIKQKTFIKQSITPTSRTHTSREQNNIFDKLFNQSLELKNKHLRRQFESKKQKQFQETLFCTFQPNSTTSRTFDDPSQFYQKNIDWLDRKNKNIKKLQMQKVDTNFKDLTLTPRINRKNKQDKQNKVKKTQGVAQFLDRYKKARQQRKYKEDRMLTPGGHCLITKRKAMF